MRVVVQVGLGGLVGHLAGGRRVRHRSVQVVCHHGYGRVDMGQGQIGRDALSDPDGDGFLRGDVS